MPGGVAPHVLQAQIGFCVDQELHEFGIPGLGGEVKRRPTVMIHGIDGGLESGLGLG